MGRRKIEIQPLTDDRNRTVTFVKRKAGLFKKAHELAVLCQVDISIIIVGNNNKLYEFSSVDTNEVIKAYQSTKPHESKSPANYGNYKKKKNLTSQISMNDELLDQDIDESDYDSDTPEPKRAKRNYESMKDESTINDRTKYNNNNTINSANSSNSSIINNSMVTNANSNDTNNTNNTNDRPLPPNHISLSRIPTFNSFHNGVIKEEEEEEEENGKAGRFLPDSTVNNHSNRPILRVQIPTDAKSGNDSARTLTALETSHNTNSNLNSNLNPRPGLALDNKINGKSPTINTPKYSSFSTFRSPDIRKPITTLPLPIHLKSQTSSPSSATAPPLPRDGMTSFFNPLRQPSPTQFNNGNNTNNNSHNNNNNNPVPTPILNQALGDKLKTINQPVQGQIPQMQMSAQQMSGGPSLTGQNIPGQLPGVPGPSGSGETPVSGLPSKYVDMFPSPLGFYPQDWSNNMTPYTNMNQYFFRHPSLAQGQPSNQQQGMNYQFPSPTQFMNQFDEKK